MLFTYLQLTSKDILDQYLVEYMLGTVQYLVISH